MPLDHIHMPFDTYAFRKMPFGLSNALNTFQMCIMSIFFDLVEQCFEISWMTSPFIENLFVIAWPIWERSLKGVRKSIWPSTRKNIISWLKENCFGSNYLQWGDRGKQSQRKFNCKSPSPHLCKRYTFFSWACRLLVRSIGDFSKIAKPFSSLLVKDVPFHFSKDYKWHFWSSGMHWSPHPSYILAFGENNSNVHMMRPTTQQGLFWVKELIEKFYVIYYVSLTLNEA